MNPEPPFTVTTFDQVKVGDTAPHRSGWTTRPCNS